MVGLHCLPASFPCPHLADPKLHSLKHHCKEVRQRPSDAAADILCPLVFPSQLSLILVYKLHGNMRHRASLNTFTECPKMCLAVMRAHCLG